jgi:hypothetical protein
MNKLLNWMEYGLWFLAGAVFGSFIEAIAVSIWYVKGKNPRKKI